MFTTEGQTVDVFPHGPFFPTLYSTSPGLQTRSTKLTLWAQQHSEPAVPVALLPRSEPSPSPSIPTDAIYSQAGAEHKIQNFS